MVLWLLPILSTRKQLKIFLFFQFPITCLVPFELKIEIQKWILCIQFRLTLQERYDGKLTQSMVISWFHSLNQLFRVSCFMNEWIFHSKLMMNIEYVDDYHYSTQSNMYTLSHEAEPIRFCLRVNFMARNVLFFIYIFFVLSLISQPNHFSVWWFLMMKNELNRIILSVFLPYSNTQFNILYSLHTKIYTIFQIFFLFLLQFFN